jgi:hypothetical protein
MTKGQRLAAALATVAIGATVGSLIADHHSESLQSATRTGRDASLVAAGAAARAGSDVAMEAAAAASLPQLRAALRNRVDAATIEDLFATEDWWLPYRERAAVLVGSGGVLIAHSTRRLAQPDADLASRAQSGGAVSAVANIGGNLVVEGAAVVDGVPGAPVLILVRPVEAGLMADWSRAAAAPLAITDGKQVLAASEGWKGPRSMAGHEHDVLAPDDGVQVAAASQLGVGLWLWAERPLPAPPDNHRWMFLGIAFAAALGAVALVVPWRPRRDRAVASGRPDDNGSGAIVESLPRIVSAARDPAGGRPSAANAATLIAKGRGQVFGRYELIEQIGEGGMSDIYTASMRGAEGFERILVVKRLKPALTRNRSAVDQFIDEARLGSLLNHPNIVQVFDFGKVDDEYYMALEYIPGWNLSQIVKRHFERTAEALDLETVFYIAHDILQALGYAHDRTNEEGERLGIVHRDVSPGNIVVSTTGDVKLIDFGIIKAESRLSQTNIGSVKGNPAFMAPEQARGVGVDPRSDLFALGLVMYYALTGDILYGGSSPAETIYRAANGLVAEDVARVLSLPDAAAQVIGRALALDPHARFQTAAAFASTIAPQALGSRATTASLMNTLFGADLRPAGEFERVRRPLGLV